MRVCSPVVSQDSSTSSRKRPFGTQGSWVASIMTAVPTRPALITHTQFSSPVIDGMQDCRRFFNLAPIACHLLDLSHCLFSDYRLAYFLINSGFLRQDINKHADPCPAAVAIFFLSNFEGIEKGLVFSQNGCDDYHDDKAQRAQKRLDRRRLCCRAVSCRV